MKKLFVIILAAALAVAPFMASDGEAAVAGSKHDQTLNAGWGGAWGGFGVCSYCHVPHSAAGARLWATSPLASVPVYGAVVVAPLCYTCHDGTAGAPADVTGSVFNTALVNHPLADSGGVPLTDQSGTGWPWTTLGGSMECSTCHNPHDNVNTNFMRDVFFADNAPADDSMFCHNCHQSRNIEAADNAQFTHPNGDLVQDARKYGTAGTVDLTNAAFNTPVQTQGGHRSGYTAGGVVCMTCHRPHGAPDGPVLVMTNYSAVEGWNTLCTTCHGIEPSLRTAVNSNTHPVENTPSNTADDTDSLGNALTIQRPLNTALSGAVEGIDGDVICMSCHDPHDGGSTPALRLELLTVGDGVCNDCHSDAPMAGSNHPVTSALFGTITLANEDGGTWPNNDGLPLYGAGTNEVWCYTCHGPHDGDPAGTFLTRIRSGSSEICNGCHTQLDNTPGGDFTTPITPPAVFGAGGDSANPSGQLIEEGFTGNWAGAVGARMGTHAAYRTVSTAAPDNTPYMDILTAASGVAGRYPGGAIICQSCHAPHGADATGGWHGTAGSNDILLLQNATGNTRTGTDGGAAAYDPTDDQICSGCHAGATNPVAPDGTHPVQSWFVSRTGVAVDTTATSWADVLPPNPNADLAPGNALGDNMVCESCHSPHAADSDMGSFALEDGSGNAATGGTRPATRNRDQLCALCHSY